MEIRQKNGVSFAVSDLLRSPHAFSTRIGGVSEEAHTSALNLAFGHGDEDETVLRNLKLFSKAVGFEPESIVSVPQIHSDRVLSVDRSHRGFGYFRPTELCGDGYVTSFYGVTLGVKTADCVPILLEARGEDGRVFAISAIHSGWRGTAKRIAKVGVGELLRLGGKAERIFAAIGPSIGSCCFEVSGECRDELAKIDEGLISPASNGKYFPDLAALNRRVLTDCGVPEENIDVSGLCTYCEEELFYSHRRQKGIRGSMLSVIFMDEQGDFDE